MDWKFLFLDSNGRIGRKDFWIGFLILFVAGFVLGLIPVLGVLISIALIYPQVCLYAKRLHDFGKSGWLAAVPYAAAAIFLVVTFLTVGVSALAAGGGADFGAGAAGGLWLVGLLAIIVGLGSLAFLRWVGLSRSDPGTNRYGAPQGSAVAGVF